MVDDQWTHAVGMVPIAGNPVGPNSIEELPEYMKTLHAIDLPRMNRIRDRVQEVVKDPSVAEKLQPWYVRVFHIILIVIWAPRCE